MWLALAKINNIYCNIISYVFRLMALIREKGRKTTHPLILIMSQKNGRSEYRAKLASSFSDIFIRTAPTKGRGEGPPKSTLNVIIVTFIF